MVEPLLSTKLFIPVPKPGLVPRPDLVSRLNQGLDRKMTLLSAPAGFGKTTLLSTWIAQSDRKTAWISLDSDDNSPVRFLLYLIKALQYIQPDIGDSVFAALQTPTPPSFQSALTHIINELTAAGQGTLILDDYHVIQSSEVHNTLTYFLGHIPENLHLIISSRSDPPFPLSRMRSQLLLNEFRTDDFRFSDEESGFYLNQLNRLALKNENIHALNTRTEGWITGLQMASLSMQNKTDRESFIQSFTGSNRYILDYLMDEVLNQQSEEQKIFLLKTSILNEFNCDLCRAVTGMDNCQAILQSLEKENLFIIPLDENRRWFRYHHLFRDLLTQQLNHSFPENIQDLHINASRWFERSGSLAPAIDHAIAGGSSNEVKRLLQKYIASIWEFGDQTKIDKWIEILPEEILKQSPDLISHYAFSLGFGGKFSRAEKQLQFGENNLEVDRELFAGMAATVRAYIALYSNKIEEAARQSELAINTLPDSQHMWRSMAYSINGDVQVFYEKFRDCPGIWQTAMDEAVTAGSCFFASLACAKLVVAYTRLGKLKQAAQVYEKHVQLYEKEFKNQIAIPGALQSVYGNILHKWDRLDEALLLHEKSYLLSDKQTYAAGISWGLISMLETLFSQKAYAQVKKTIQLLEERTTKENLPAWGLSWVSAWKARLCVQEGNLEKAEQILHERGITPEGEIRFPRQVEYLALARVFLQQGSETRQKTWFLKAQKVLNRLQQNLTEMYWIDLLYECQLLQIMLHRETGDQDIAVDLLESHLGNTQPEEYIRLYLDEGIAMKELFTRLIAKKPHTNHAAKILDLFSIGDAYETKEASSTLPDPLSERELEVLYLLSEGASNQKVSDTLFIAQGTVKNHLKNIYSKLQVHSRTAAVARARELDLIK